MTSDTPQSDEPGAALPSGIDSAKLRNAMKAFKKRLKLTRLDDESRLGHGAMSSGGPSGIVAITPPTRYPQAVWDELVRQGRLRRAGYGLYELPGQA
jgi:hypothetical protein